MLLRFIITNNSVIEEKKDMKKMWKNPVQCQTFLFVKEDE